MGAPKIRQIRKEALRIQRNIHRSLRQGSPAFVTVVQNENTKKILGILHNRGDAAQWYEWARAKGIDADHAELIDQELFIGGVS